VPNRAGLLAADDSLLEVKPMQTFLQRLEERLQLLVSGGHQPPDISSKNQAPTPSLRITIVGGGAGGVELTFCLPMRIRKVLGDVPLSITLIDSGDKLLKGSSMGLVKRVERDFANRGVKIVLSRRVTQVKQGSVTLDNGETIPGDLVLWVTSAAPPPLFKDIGLPKDERGFLLTRQTLQSTSDEPIFVVGDSGTIAGERLPKAGVYAVREGPMLWENLQRMLRQEPLRDYKPQRGFLKLLNRGDGSALGEYRGWSFAGNWVWRLKDRIDGKFMDMYQDYTPGMESAPASGIRPTQMRCAGCGGKVGASILSRALARLDIPRNEHVLLGLDAPDDAALIQPTPHTAIAATVDFFQAPLDDPYLVGRMAALHAASDVLAKGARPFAALAMATIPPGPERKQEQLLYELLAGGLHELKAMGATLAGGHTIEGSSITVGFTILAEQAADTVRAKGKLRDGDVLILTKPLGVGVLLAAHMQSRCKAEWYGPLIETMLQSNVPAAALFDEFGVAAATDITGFGLAGHLLEMLRPANLAAELFWEDIKMLPGTDELLREGLESTLAPSNRQVESEVDDGPALSLLPTYSVIFDPQTCGGLLIGVREDCAASLVHRLKELRYSAAVIGRVDEHDPDSWRVRFTSSISQSPTPQSSSANHP
jgi:selenide,water dikinase